MFKDDEMINQDHLTDQFLSVLFLFFFFISSSIYILYSFHSFTFNSILFVIFIRITNNAKPSFLCVHCTFLFLRVNQSNNKFLFSFLQILCRVVKHGQYCVCLFQWIDYVCSIRLITSWNYRFCGKRCLWNDIFRIQPLKGNISRYMFFFNSQNNMKNRLIRSFDCSTMSFFKQWHEINSSPKQRETEKNALNWETTILRTKNTKKKKYARVFQSFWAHVMLIYVYTLSSVSYAFFRLKFFLFSVFIFRVHDQVHTG